MHTRSPTRCFHDAPRVKPNARMLQALRDCDAHCGLRERGVHGFEPPTTGRSWLGAGLACACLLLSVAAWVPPLLRVAVALVVSLALEGMRHPH